MKIYKFALVFLIVALFFVYQFTHNRLVVEADRMLNYSFISRSPEGSKYVGFIEDCSGKMSNITSNSCVRMLFFYDVKAHTRGTCFMPGGYANTPMFTDLTVNWLDETSLQWSSEWSSGKPVSQPIDFGHCDDYSGILSRFELIPTLAGTLKYYQEQDLAIAKRLNRKIMDEAMKVIKTN